MNRNDVIDTLTKIAAFDRRTVGEGDIAAWQETIGHLHREDALAAVSAHFRTSDKWLMPVHLVTLAREIARDRMLRESPEERLARTDAIDAVIDSKSADRQAQILAFATGKLGRIA
jgi:hypothetical protein